MTHPRLFRTGTGTPSHPAHVSASPATGQAFAMLRTVFTIAPIVSGVDKFVELLTDWDKYLAPWMNDLAPGTAHQAMLAVGVIEILAGVLVAVRPDIGGYVVAGWLAGIIVNLVIMGEYLDVALRDFGLLVGALALARLAHAARTSRQASAAGEPRRA